MADTNIPKYNNPLMYNGGSQSSPSSIDKAQNKAQMQTFMHLKKAIIESRKEQYFMPLASVTDMPKHMGKTIKVYEYIPLLDDRNKNDQGIDAKGAHYENGNLYGSSKDIGVIDGKLPLLAEGGGRVNRVGFSRIEREGSIQKFGFFTEFTQEALDFDTDDQLNEHLSRELMNGAVQLTEAVLQKDLLTQAGTVHYAGKAIQDDQVTGEGPTPSVLTYTTLKRLDRVLTDKRCPKKTKVITGSRMIDTKTLPAARVAYVGSEVVPLLEKMKDPFGNPAWVPVQQYADAGTILNGEIGSCAGFRFVEVPEMLHWAGKGATHSESEDYRYTGSKYDIYPVLVVGDDSFTTIGFQTDGKTLKFSVITKMPGANTAGRDEPYGEVGFSSIKWFYGTLIKRPERLGLIKTVAPL